MPMSRDIAIHAENVSKQYRLGVINHGTLYRDLQSWWARLRNQPDPNSQVMPGGLARRNSRRIKGEFFNALSDVSFTVRQGEILGIVGRNGAGKSTLLKIISRITAPSGGYIGIRGRMASLLEVGTGFHPELTGRENVFLNGAILGMRKAEIQRKLEQIVEFAEVGEFLDTPVKRYSSGMYVRLAFSVAAHLDSDILLVDEVLAVGDTAFQRKCLGKMESVATSGRTILFVSHNMTAIESLCTKALVLDEGTVGYSGDVKEGLHRYLAEAVIREGEGINFQQRSGDGRATVESVQITDFEGNALELIRSGMDVAFRVGIKRHAARVRDSLLAMGITTLSGDGVMHFSTETFGLQLDELGAEMTMVCKIPRLPLRGGVYSMNLFLKSSGMINDYLIDAYRFEIVDGDFYGTGKMPSEGYPYFLPTYRWDALSQ
jgi:lipopolysaccharide transport system ATP-binding protein